MSRQTSRGEAPITLVCEVFKVSRAAFYAANKPISVLRPAPSTPKESRGVPVTLPPHDGPSGR